MNSKVWRNTNPEVAKLDVLNGTDARVTAIKPGKTSVFTHNQEIAEITVVESPPATMRIEWSK